MAGTTDSLHGGAAAPKTAARRKARPAPTGRAPRPIRKVLLVYPFTTADSYGLEDILNQNVEVQPPLGLGYLAAYFRAFGPPVDIEVLDANAMAVRLCLEAGRVDMAALWQALEDAIRACRPDLVGISCLFHVTAAPSHRTAARVKAIDPGILTVMGGNYAHVSWDEALKDPNLDLAVFSEGEQVLVNLVQAINAGEDWRTVRGIGWRDASAGPVRTEPQPLLADIDRIPECDRRGLDLEFYSRQGRQMAFRFLDRHATRITTVVASRGCPHRCTFCSARLVWGGKFRFRDPVRVVDEMVRLRDEHGTNAFCFLDDNLAANRRAFLGLADEMARRLGGAPWFSLGGMQVSSMNDEVVDATVRSGCRWFILPVESGNAETLRRIGKPHNPESVARAVASIRRHPDAWVAANIITGFPFETKADIEHTFEFARGLDVDWIYVFRFMPLPGTPMYDECIEAGLTEPYRWRPDRMGELAPLNTAEFNAAYVAERNYAFNAEFNFFRNRNIAQRPQQAIGDFEYVLRTAPRHPLAMYGLACAYETLGDMARSAEWLERALALVEAEALEEAAEAADASTAQSISKSFFVVSHAMRYVEYFQAQGVDLRQRLKRARLLLGCT